MTPEHHLFDFRQPNLVQEFKLVQDSYLLIEFSLLVKGANSAGIFSFFFKMDPGFDVYIGNVKVFNFKQHGINDEKWHKYRLTMNKTEQLQHLKESGLSNLLVTINVRSMKRPFINTESTLCLGLGREWEQGTCGAG